MASGLRVWLRQTQDRALASDPGLTRLRQAFSAAFAMATSLGIEYGFARLQGAGPAATLVPMILGAVLGLMGSMALAAGGAWEKTRTAVFFPVALGLGLLLGTLVASRIDAMLGVFVLVMFVAVFVRRFGPQFFFYGFMFWMGYFFASFLHAKLSMFPALLAAAAIATVWVLLLSVTVLRTHHRRTLRRTVRAFGARVRAVARVCAELDEIAEPGADRWQRRLQARQNRMAETALVIEGWSAEPGALPRGWSAAALRRQLVNAQLAIDDLANAAKALAGGDAQVRAAAARIAGRLARHEYAEADAAAHVLLSRVDGRDAGSWWAARHFGTAVAEFVAVTRQFDQVRTGAADAEFEPVVSLVMGGLLPGSPAIAGDVRPRGRWGLLGRLDFTTRQAIQVAIAGGLAILAGRELSETRYYWAVLAAFIAFVGTATRSETFVKATNRVIGTLVGLGAGIGLAHVTAGHTGWILATITVSLFCGMYLIQTSYAYMIFFITIMVSQLYSALDEFSSGLLVLRLEETAIGAAVGILVALTLTPLSTRDVVGAVQKDLLTGLAGALATAGDRLRGRSVGDLDTVARTLDNRLRQLNLVAAPLTRTLLWGNNPRLARHRLTLCASGVHYGRRLTTAVRRPAPVLADASLALAEVCTALAETLAVPGKRPEPAEHLRERLADADAALFTGTADDHPAHRPLTQLWHLLSELIAAAPVPQPAPTPADRALSIAGTVRGTGGRTLAGATVTLVDTASRQLGKATTTTDGGYRLRAPRTGTYLLVTLAAGYDANAVRITTAGRSATHDLTLTPPVAVAGTVTTAGEPVAGAHLALIAASGAAAAATRSDTSGRFALSGAEPGRYTLVSSAGGYRPVARTVTVQESTTTEDVDLVRSGVCETR